MPSRYHYTPRVLRASQPEEPRHLDDEAAVLQLRRPAQRRVPLVVVHDEELAARAVLPAEAQVAAEQLASRVVLDQPEKNIRGVNV